MTTNKILKIQRQKNAAFLSLPIRLLIEFKLKIGSSLAVFQTPEGVLLRPVRRRYSFDRLTLKNGPDAPAVAHMKSLDERLAAFDPTLHGGEAMVARPIGREIL
jgi:antitoxin component of MazEF toxin-antitoxin module